MFSSKMLRHGLIASLFLSGLLSMAHAQSTLAPEETTVDELSTEGIFLTCSDTQMIVDVPTELLTGDMAGEHFQFENENSTDCVGVDDEATGVIRLTTNLTGCGTEREETDEYEIYTNRVINTYTTDTIIRYYAIEIPLSCTYNRTARVSDDRHYRLTDYTLDVALDESGKFSFEFDIFEDNSFADKYESYPVRIGLNEALYFAASVLSLDDSLDLSIQACRATPSSNYNDKLSYDFIENGVSIDTTTNITCVDEFKIGVGMDTFRFVQDDDLVYLHCDLLVCDADNSDSLCEQQCPDSTAPASARRRRAVEDSGALSTKRVTRGPIRIVRSANGGEVSRLGYESGSDNTSSSAFNPWMVAIAGMATVVLAIAAMMVAVLRQVSKLSAAKPAKHDEQESERLLA